MQIYGFWLRSIVLNFFAVADFGNFAANGFAYDCKVCQARNSF